jgi:hypothetical protein
MKTQRKNFSLIRSRSCRKNYCPSFVAILRRGSQVLNKTLFCIETTGIICIVKIPIGNNLNSQTPRPPARSKVLHQSPLCPRPMVLMPVLAPHPGKTQSIHDDRHVVTTYDVSIGRPQLSVLHWGQKCAAVPVYCFKQCAVSHGVVDRRPLAPSRSCLASRSSLAPSFLCSEGAQIS